MIILYYIYIYITVGHSVHLLCFLPHEPIFGYVPVPVLIISSSSSPVCPSSAPLHIVKSVHSLWLCSKCHTIILLLLFLQHVVCMLRIVCKFSVCMEYPDVLLFLPESANIIQVH